MKKKKRTLDILLNVFGVIVLCVITLLIVRNTCYQEIYIIGGSMNPNLANNEHGYMNITKSARTKFSRFDIVVLDIKDIGGPDDPIIKRVIAFEGETIYIDYKTGDIKVNQKLINQSFISEDSKKETCSNASIIPCDKDFVIPKDTIFVLGDNRQHSSDSLTYGAIPKSSVLGRLAVIFKMCNEDQKACRLITPRFY